MASFSALGPILLVDFRDFQQSDTGILPLL
jgi:hypothetical protein